MGYASDSDEYSDESDDSDDEFYENSGKKTARNRPGTAMGHTNDSKKFKASKKSVNRIKNLRSLQEKNRLNENVSLIIYFINLLFLKSYTLSLILNIKFQSLFL